MTFLLWWLAVSLVCTLFLFWLVAVDDSDYSDDYDDDPIEVEHRALLDAYRT